MYFKKHLTKDQAYQKLKHYCGYQDRSHSEVKEKAYALGMRKTEVEEITAELIEEGCLDEERFAVQFAGGKFRIKQWGRVKIKYELKQKRVSDYCIRKALEEINEEEYLTTLNKLAQKKWNSIKGAGINHFVKMTKTRNYLLQKGFESVLVNGIINKMATKNKGAT